VTDQPNWVASSAPFHLRMEPDPDSEILTSFRISHNGERARRRSNAQCNAPLPDSSTLRSYLIMVNLFLGLTNWALRREGVWGSWCIDPCFLHLGTSWRWVVSFTPLPLNPRGKRPRYSLDRRLGEPRSRSKWYGEVNILDATGTRTPTARSSSP
jgi:hypothetical protein